MQNVEFIILAGGKGKRMESDLPKALIPLGEHTLIDHVIKAVKGLQPPRAPIIVVGHKHEDVRAHLGDGYLYVEQKEQLGTGHAVSLTEKYLEKNANTIVVLFTDHPLLKTSTIKKLIDLHTAKKPAITMAVTEISDFSDWREVFLNFSRVIRDKEGKMIRTIEYRDLKEEERGIREVNPAYLVFDRAWLFKHIHSLSNNNSQNEYYVTDLVKTACEEGRIETVAIAPVEALGVNTKTQLAHIEGLLK
jgi:bifunctional UDP-N-acetylglucosamine pyrophosphorylase/glucosamine-1-phosphate N-acetyltransferase